MTKLRPISYVCRHGQEYEPGNIFNGWIDAPLTERGVEEEDKLRQYLSDVPNVRIIWSSPLMRAWRTANAINEHHHVAVLQHRGLLGWGLGVFDGMPHDLGKEAIDLFVEHPTVEIPNGEAFNRSVARIESFFNDALSQDSADKPGIYVTHSHTIAVLEGLINGTKFTEKPSSPVATGGVCEIYLDGKEYVLEPVLRVKQPK